MNPTTMAEKPMFPTHRSSPFEGEPDALKGARPVRWGGWRKPAGAFRPLAAVPTQSIRRRIRELLGLRPRQRVPAGTTVELWLGISTDEAIRMKTSRDRWTTNRYPLIEVGMSRSDCLNWWKERYDRPLERSACVACPFQSRHRWVETKRRWPEVFAEAVEIDADLRDSNQGLALDKTPYLHTLRMPLAQAVALDEAEMGDDGHRDGFGNECEGHCGI